MKLDDLIDNPAQSSFEYPKDTEQNNMNYDHDVTGYEDIKGSGSDKKNNKNDFESQVFIPTHVNIDDSTEVQLKRDGKVIKKARWDDMIGWIRNNWSNMTGIYYITQGTAVLHTIRISNRNKDNA